MGLWDYGVMDSWDEGIYGILGLGDSGIYGIVGFVGLWDCEVVGLMGLMGSRALWDSRDSGVYGVVGFGDLWDYGVDVGLMWGWGRLCPTLTVGPRSPLGPNFPDKPCRRQRQRPIAPHSAP